MQIRNTLVWLTLSALVPAPLLEARIGKIYFPNGHFLKGDIQVQKTDDGRELVVMAMHSGSLSFSKEEVAKIVYFGETESASQKIFLQALKNTPDHPTEIVSAPTPYDGMIRLASQKHKLDPELVKAVIKQESNFNRVDVSKRGAQGLMQLMPDTARELGVTDSFDPWENIHGGTQYLRLMLESFNGDVKKALAAYNSGPDAVKKYGSVPPYRETQNYVKNVLRYYKYYRGNKIYSLETKNGLVFTDEPYLP